MISVLKLDKVREIRLSGEYSGVNTETTSGCCSGTSFIFVAQNFLLAGDPDEEYGIGDG